MFRCANATFISLRLVFYHWRSSYHTRWTNALSSCSLRMVMFSSLARCRWKPSVMFRYRCPMSLHCQLILFWLVLPSCPAIAVLHHVLLSLLLFHVLLSRSFRFTSFLPLIWSKSRFGCLTRFLGTFSAYAALIIWIIRSVCTLSFNECFSLVPLFNDWSGLCSGRWLACSLLTMLSSFVLRLAQRFSFSLHAGECMLLLLICRLWLLHDCASLVAALYSIVVCLFTDTRVMFWLGALSFWIVLVWALSAHSALNIDPWSMIHLVGLAHVNSCSE